MSATILLVDDDAGMAKIITFSLEGAGYKVRRAKNVDAAFAQLKAEAADLILLDVEMPGLSGFDMLRMLKEREETAGLPVIMLTVRGDESAKVSGLKSGADDYLVKPFSAKELLARVEALLRRVQRSGQTSGLLESSGVAIDMAKQQVWVNGKPVDLRRTELQLLYLLMQHKGYVLSYQQLGQALAQGGEAMTSGNLQTHVKNLRGKLGPAAERIETAYAVGYKFVEK